MLSEAFFVVYMTNWTLPGVPVSSNIEILSQCSVLALSLNRTSFFYNQDRKSCIINHLETFHTTNGLTSSPGFRYYLHDAPKCGPPPVFQNSNMRLLSSSNGVTTAKYVCNVGYFMVNTDTSVCSVTAWSTGVECRAISTCSDVKSCNSSYLLDGEYWLYPNSFNNQRIRIYCKDMNTTNPLEYITLYGYNYSESPPGYYDFFCTSIIDFQAFSGKTEFLKIKVDLQNKEIDGEDLSFTNQIYGNRKKYGVAEACSASLRPDCPERGKSILNLTSTGFKFNSENNWKAIGYQGSSSVVFRDDHVIVVTGDGGCGGSGPDGPIKFQLDPSNNPEINSATDPVCF